MGGGGCLCRWRIRGCVRNIQCRHRRRRTLRSKCKLCQCLTLSRTNKRLFPTSSQSITHNLLNRRRFLITRRRQQKRNGKALILTHLWTRHRQVYPRLRRSLQVSKQQALPRCKTRTFCKYRRNCVVNRSLYSSTRLLPFLILIPFCVSLCHPMSSEYPCKRRTKLRHDLLPTERLLLHPQLRSEGNTRKRPFTRPCSFHRRLNWTI